MLSMYVPTLYNLYLHVRVLCFCFIFQDDHCSSLEALARVLMGNIYNLEKENKCFSHTNKVTKGLISNAISVLDEYIRSHDAQASHIGELQKEIQRLTQENERLADASDLLEQRVERLEAVNSQQTAAFQPSPEPDTRSQFTAFACTFDNVTMNCPDERKIWTNFAVYGRFKNPPTDCASCCAPNPQSDCTEVVEVARPDEWKAILELCEERKSCEFTETGTALTECSGELSHYIQLFYACLPNDETAPVAFTAWANTGSPKSYRADDVIVFNEVLTNAGGHYNAATSSFICPWHGVYLISASIECVHSARIDVDLMRNYTFLVSIFIDDISALNRGSTSIVVECDRGDKLWVRARLGGIINGYNGRNVFSAHMIQRFGNCDFVYAFIER